MFLDIYEMEKGKGHRNVFHLVGAQLNKDWDLSLIIRQILLWCYDIVWCHICYLQPISSGVCPLAGCSAHVNINDVRYSAGLLSYPSPGHLSRQFRSHHHNNTSGTHSGPCCFFLRLNGLRILRSWQMLHPYVRISISIDGVLRWLKQFWVYRYDMSTSWRGDTLPFPLQLSCTNLEI